MGKSIYIAHLVLISKQRKKPFELEIVLDEMLTECLHLELLPKNINRTVLLVYSLHLHDKGMRANFRNDNIVTISQVGTSTVERLVYEDSGL